jgi:hypothetical protein
MIRIEALIDDVDYNALIDKFAPLLAEQALKKEDPEKARSGAIALPFVKYVLKQLPDEKKEEMTVQLLNSGKQDIEKKIISELASNGITLRIAEMKAEQQ